MQLHGSYTSPYVRHCRMALSQEGFDFEFVATDFTQSNQQSPTRRVPFLHDGDLFLTDSTAILFHIRQKAGKPLFQDAAQCNRYCMVNTVMDTGVNIFLLERDGITDSPYIQRQKARVDSGFEALAAFAADWDGSWDDSWIRMACLLAWVNFRKRYDISGYDSLVALLAAADDLPFFTETTPPES
ncbi:MAG: glutathione S-transferase family protein [Acidobacteriota bacterium]|nr:glutathione S-transferase family protein [Acidobacteriota bacterium]